MRTRSWFEREKEGWEEVKEEEEEEAALQVKNEGETLPPLCSLYYIDFSAVCRSRVFQRGGGVNKSQRDTQWQRGGALSTRVCVHVCMCVCITAANWQDQ